jgi:hypothetical protein
MVSSLDVIWTTRSGRGGRTERRYLDFVIDGLALSSRFDADFISPLGWLAVQEQVATIDRLLRRKPPDLAHGRTSLYICPECGDLGCGAVTAVVGGGTGVVVWSDFGIQNNYEDVVHREGFEAIGPFTFDGMLYHRLFARLQPMMASINTNKPNSAPT